MSLLASPPSRRVPAFDLADRMRKAAREADLSNGYLAVSGEKQVAFDKGNEYIRFSGVVNPDSILNGNQVASTQVADARLEYRSNTRIDPVEVASQLGRFFLSVLPF